MKRQLVLTNLIALLSIVALLIVVAPTHASPTAFTVDSSLDEPAAVVGVCVSTPSGKCTLRAAIQAANFVPGADTIMLPAGIYTLTIAGANEDNAATGDLDIKDDLTITGAGAETTIVDGNQLDRVFDILNASRVNISGLTIRNGGNADYGGGIRSNGGFLLLSNSAFTSNTASQGGGGVFSTGNLTVTSSIFLTNTALRGGGINVDSGSVATVIDSVLSGNKTTSGSGGNNGGAIFNFKAALAVINTTLSNNSADGGGAIINDQGMLTVDRSTFSNNTALYGGGAIHSNGTSVVTNTTIYSNTANRGGAIRNMQFGTGIGAFTLMNGTLVNNSATSGGGIFNTGGLTITNSTLSNNTANSSFGGGAIHNATVTGTVTVLNSTMISNSAGSNGGSIRIESGTGTLKNTIVAFGSPNNCSGIIMSQGHNLEYGNTCSLTATGDITNTNPLVGPLQNNGGSTLTHALLPGSPAIDAGDDVGCPATDQRGVARPQGAHCDIGAYETTLIYPIYLPVILR